MICDTSCLVLFSEIALVYLDSAESIPSVGKDIFVRGEITLPVQHCLMARKGVAFEDIERIVSHEQVRTSDRLFVTRGERVSLYRR